MVSYGISRLNWVCKCKSGLRNSCKPRIHDFAGFLEAYEAAVQAGYTNINVDVMSGLPGQTLESLYEERVSLYEKYADIIVDEEDKDLEGSLQLVLQALKRGEK